MPSCGFDSIQIRPPCCSTVRRRTTAIAKARARTFVGFSKRAGTAVFAVDVLGRSGVGIGEAIAFLESIFGPFGADAGVPPNAVERCEARLGVAIPKALAELHLRTANVEALHAAHNLLVPLDCVDFGGDHLVFYEENQEVVVWAIARERLSEDDPPVDQGQPASGRGDEWSYFPEFRSVSEFACAQGAWQAVQGGLPYVGVLANDPNVERALNALGPPSLEAETMTAWLVSGGVLLHAGDGYVGLATRDAESFRRASSSIGLDIAKWDYATLHDEQV